MTIAALLALPAQAEAQAEVLVSNVGKASSGGGNLHDFDQAQAFTTGSNSAGYTLTSVEIEMQADTDYSTAITVSVHSINGSTPGISLGTLSNPTSISRDGVYAFTTRGIALAADTTYFVVIDRVGNIHAAHEFLIKNTTSNAQDPGKASGWVIADDSRYRDWNSSGFWSLFIDSNKIRVKGINPGVSNASISIADASAAENAGHLLFDITLSRALQNTVKVDFETISGGTATEGDDYHARRTYTHVILAGNRTAQMGFALIEDTINDAGETVNARLRNAREINAYGHVLNSLNITTSEATGTITAPTATTTNVPGLTIGIQDATGNEDDGWLVFRVRLSRKYTDYVCYDFETVSGGTATEGTDYSKRPKVGQWMQTGKRVDKPFVRIIDDSENDDGETVMVKISNARLCDDASQTLSITRADATGTIRNSEPASGDNNWSEESAGTPITPVPALPLAGIGILGLLLALLGSRRAVCGFLAVAALLTLPTLAQAQTTIWSSTLTVRTLETDTFGCTNFIGNNNPCSTYLSDTDFTYDRITYSFPYIAIYPPSFLRITVNSDLATATQNLTLNVDGRAFPFEDALNDPGGSPKVKTWNNAVGLTWTEGDTVSLTLTDPNGTPGAPKPQRHPRSERRRDQTGAWTWAGSRQRSPAPTSSTT